ncbi:MAG: BlaI/MecI/CopY family transcriptional regulator [Bacteroidota bacterium]
MSLPRLNLREREVLDVVHRLGRASAEAVRETMPAPPTNSAVRALLRTLEQKGHIRHEKEGRRFIYTPTVAPKAAGRTALRHVVQTFFADTPEDAFATLLSETGSDLSGEHLDRLDAMIQEAREADRRARREAE